MANTSDLYKVMRPEPPYDPTITPDSEGAAPASAYGPAPRSAPYSPTAVNPNELSSRVQQVSDLFRQLYGQPPDPKMAFALGVSDLTHLDITRLLMRSAPLFAEGTGDFLKNMMSFGPQTQPQPGPGGDTPPVPGQPKPDTGQGLLPKLELPKIPNLQKDVVVEQQHVENLQDVRAMLVSTGFLAPSQIRSPDQWDEATVKAFLRYYDRSYSNLADQQQRAISAGYGHLDGVDLKADGILTKEWVRAFGEQANDDMQVEKSASTLPWILAPAYRVLPHNKEVRQLVYDAAWRQEDIGVLTAPSRAIHTIGSLVSIIGSFFPPFVAKAYIENFSDLQNDDKYMIAMDDAYRSLGLRTRAQMNGVDENGKPKKSWIPGVDGSAAWTGEVLSSVIARAQQNPTAMKALEDAAKVREAYMQKMPDATYMQMFGVTNRQKMMEDENLRSAAVATDIMFDFLLMGGKGAKGFIPRGNPLHVQQNRGAQELAEAVTDAAQGGRWASVIDLLGGNPDSKKLTTALRQGEERAAKSGGHISQRSVMAAISRTYANENYNIKLSLDHSDRFRAFLNDHYDMPLARMLAMVPKAGPVYAKNDPKIYAHILNYAREIYRDNGMVDSVAYKLTKAKSPAMVMKVIDEINDDIGRFYHMERGEIGTGSAYLGDARSGKAATRTRIVAGSPLDEPAPLLPSEQRARAYFVNLGNLERKLVDVAPGAPPRDLLAQVDHVSDLVMGQISPVFKALNVVAMPFRLSMTVLSPALATRKYLTAGLRRIWDAGFHDPVNDARFEAALATDKASQKYYRFMQTELDAAHIGYEIGTDGPVRPFGGRFKAQSNMAIARDFFRRLYDDELVSEWSRGIRGPGPMPSHGVLLGNRNAARDEVRKWLAKPRGVRLTEQFGHLDPAGNPDTLRHAAMVSDSLYSYLREAKQTMTALLDRTGNRTADLKRVFDTLETTKEDPWVSGLVHNAQGKKQLMRDFVTATFSGALDTDKIPVIGDWLGNHGVEQIPYGFARPMGHERMEHFKILASKNFAELEKVNPGARHNLQVAMELGLEQTHHVQLNLANRLNIENSLRWTAYFATKKRLWFTMLSEMAWKNPGVRGAFHSSMTELEKMNEDQPEYLRYSIPVNLPFESPWGPKGTQIRFAVDRMLWLSEMPLFSSIITLPITLLSDKQTVVDDLEKGNVSSFGFSRFDSAIYTAANLKKWSDNPKTYRESLGEKEYQTMLADSRTDPDTLRLFLDEHPELRRFYTRINHNMMIAELRGVPITRDQAERQAMISSFWESGIPMVRPVSAYPVEPERQKFLKEQAAYEAIQDDPSRRAYFENSTVLKEWRYLYEDPDRRQQLIDGWSEYYQLRSQMDQWSNEFYGLPGDTSKAEGAVVNRYEAFKKEQWFQNEIDAIGKKYPEWSRVFLDDDRTDKVVAERSRAYDLLQSVFPNLQVTKQDLMPSDKEVSDLRAVDKLADASLLFEGTPAEADFRILLADARRLSGDLSRFKNTPQNENEAVVQKYIQQVYYPAMDGLSYYFAVIDELKKNKVPTSSFQYKKVYDAIKEARDAAEGPFVVDGMRFPGIEAVQWGGWDGDVRHDHLVSWAMLTPNRRTKFQQSMVDANDRNALFREGIQRKLSGGKILEEAGL